MNMYGLIQMNEEMINQIKADAWAEGFDAGIDNALFDKFVFNPYVTYSDKAQEYINERLQEQA